MVLASKDKIASRWPGHAAEVMALVHVLRIAEPSLADAVDTGLVAVSPAGKKATDRRIEIAHMSTRLKALPRRCLDGEVIREASAKPWSVDWLEVESLMVGVG